MCQSAQPAGMAGPQSAMSGVQVPWRGAAYQAPQQPVYQPPAAVQNAGVPSQNMVARGGPMTRPVNLAPTSNPVQQPVQQPTPQPVAQPTPMQMSAVGGGMGRNAIYGQMLANGN